MDRFFSVLLNGFESVNEVREDQGWVFKLICPTLILSFRAETGKEKRWAEKQRSAEESSSIWAM
jgi:hypothetical protein